MERAKQVKKILAAMPAGTRDWGTSLMWSTRGGYAGEKSIARSLEKLKGLGFNKQDTTAGNTPDGSYVSSGEIYVNEQGDKLTYSKTYGNVASDNSFGMQVSLTKIVS